MSEMSNMNASDSANFEGPSWSLSNMYESLESPAIARDLQIVEQQIAEIESLSSALAEVLPRASTLTETESRAFLPTAVTLAKLQSQTKIILQGLGTYAMCSTSIDSTLEVGNQLYAKALKLEKVLEKACNPFVLFMTLVSQEIFECFLADPSVTKYRFLLEEFRTQRHLKLSLAEENILKVMSVDGVASWTRLYSMISSGLECVVEQGDNMEKMGVAKAANLLSSADPKQRKAAYLAMQAEWNKHEQACASALNSISGWRLQECQLRSEASGKEEHFLNAPLRDNRISNATLETMWSVVEENFSVSRDALLLQAKILGKTKLDPWDMFAPFPSDEKNTSECRLSFEKGLALVEAAFRKISPEMGDFVRLAADKKWIDGGAGDKRSPGAYQAEFDFLNEPRIFLTYDGGMGTLLTLAHELGHAYHFWAMKELPCELRTLSMSLAETASVFGEIALTEHLASNSQSDFIKPILWADLENMGAYLINIPTRFFFEKEYYELRREKVFSPRDLKNLMTKAWEHCYGETTSECNEMFWASKQHFYSEDRFYNFPYTFGYLFSLGVYAQRAHFGNDFFRRYVALLRDTGCMSVEALAKKHLDVDISKPDFWRLSFKLVVQKLSRAQEIFR
jgi:oligoendopeptidase F